MSRKLSPSDKTTKPSGPEQRLLDFARQQFGEHLSQFLLAGLGEGNVGQRRGFIIHFSGDENIVLRRHVEVITYEPLNGLSYLPRHRDPLVLLALLYLLLQGDHALPNLLCYTQDEVLGLLGWNDTKKTRREIDEAVKRYSLITYKWKMNESEIERRNLSYYTADENLISKYHLIYSEIRESGLERVLNQIAFNAHFINQLLHRSLFEIEWIRVQSISRQ
jgi:hypothetical protein